MEFEDVYLKGLLENSPSIAKRNTRMCMCFISTIAAIYIELRMTVTMGTGRAQVGLNDAVRKRASI